MAEFLFGFGTGGMLFFIIGMNIGLGIGKQKSAAQHSNAAMKEGK